MVAEVVKYNEYYLMKTGDFHYNLLDSIVEKVNWQDSCRTHLVVVQRRLL